MSTAPADLATSSPEDVVALTARLARIATDVGRDPDEIVLMHEAIISAGDPAGELVARVEMFAPLGVRRRRFLGDRA